MRNQLILSTLFFVACDVPTTAQHAAPLVPRECAPDPSGAAGAPAEPPVEIDLEGAPILGDPAAPVTVVVFSDFECPFCKKGAEVARALLDKYPGRVRVAFKHNPLPFHERAPAAALAAIAAARQDKFWVMHDRLFDAQDLSDESIGLIAEEVGLDMGRFAKDAASARARLDADVKEAQRLGVKGTPTFFVNGRRLVGARPLSAFAALIEGC